MPVPRTVRIGCYLVCFVLLLIGPWILVLRFFFRFFYSPYSGLWDALESAPYIPILAFLAAIATRFLSQRLFCASGGFAGPGTRERRARRIAVALVLGGTGLAAAWCGWISSRTILPLDTFISLSPGHLRTTEFKINVASKYWVYVELDHKPELDELDCLLGFAADRCNGTTALLNVSWTLSRAGIILAEGGSKNDPRTFETADTSGRGLGYFDIEQSDHLELDLNVLSDTSRLNAANPRLKIEEMGGIYWEYRSQTVLVLLVCLSGVLVGSALWLQLGSIVGSRSPVQTAPLSQKTGLTLHVEAWIGGILVVVGLSTFLAVHRWMSSRTFVALDMPISLARGPIRAGPFKINLNDDYTVRIDTGWESYFDPNCPSYDRVKANWFLIKDGRQVATWLASTPATYLGGFNSEKGTYELDVEVLSDSGCLNPGHPRLLVYTSKADYDDSTGPILWASAFSIAVGAGLMALGFIGLAAEFHPQSTRISDSASVGQSFQWAQRLPLRQEVSSPPAFALLAAPCLIVLIIVFMVLLQPYPSKGLRVQVLKPGSSGVPNDPFSSPVVVQLLDAGMGVPPSVYVNSKATSWNKLGNDLKDELKLRPKWVVYVEADPNLPWSDVMNVVDVAKGLHARVVLLTLKPKLETSRARAATKSQR